MHALVVTAIYPPEPVVSSRTSAQIAQELAARGHTVTVITAFPNRPGGRLYPGFRRRPFVRERRDGTTLVRCFAALAPESRMLPRLLENLSFGVTAALAVLAAPRAHVVYANTWPVFATALLCAAARVRRIPIVASIQDVYPDSLVAQGRIGADSLLASSMRWIDTWNARQARAVIAISERFAALYRARGLASERVHVVANWLDGPDFAPDPDGAADFRAAHGVAPGDCLALYGGNVGVAAGVETLVDAWRCLDGADGLRLVIAGEGNSLAACRSRARALPAGRVSFHTPWPADETAAALGAADVLLLPTRGAQSMVSVPSKLIAYLLAAKPVVALALPGSDLADLVERSGAGWIAAPDAPDALAAQLRAVAALDPAERARRGAAGRAFALQHLTREACLPRVIELLEQCATPNS